MSRACEPPRRRWREASRPWSAKISHTWHQKHDPRGLEHWHNGSYQIKDASLKRHLT